MISSIFVYCIWLLSSYSHGKILGKAKRILWPKRMEDTQNHDDLSIGMLLRVSPVA